MYITPDCLPCFLRQALQWTRQATDDQEKQREVLDETAAMICQLSNNTIPVEIGRRIHDTVVRITGVADPYNNEKKRANEQVLGIYHQLRQHVRCSENPLLTALKLSAAGNVIDFGANDSFNLEESLTHALTGLSNVFDYARLQRQLDEVDRVVYIGDNAGEIVLDKLVIEELAVFVREIVFAVRDGPIINDVTLHDAAFVEMDEVATVVSTGSTTPGAILDTCSPEFREIFHEAPLIIAKGQGNFEALSNVNAPLFFLLKVKCSVVAGRIGAKQGDIVLLSRQEARG